MTKKRAALWAAPLSLALLLAACSGDDDSADDTTTTTTTTEATTSSSESTETTAPPASETTASPPASETTAPPPSSDTTAPPPTEPPSQAGEPIPTEALEWASELVRAWGAGDRERALELARVEVVDEMFGHADPGGDDWEAQGCDGYAGALRCTFTSASRGEELVTEQGGPNGVLQPISDVDFG